MCGIAAIVGLSDLSALGAMVKIQHHRGPNDGGMETFSSPSGNLVGLGSRRLSILDLSPAGHMPMWNDDRTLCLVYNGEAYNFRELRGELEQRGHRFRSHTDTEVVLRLYEEHGTAAIKRLEGMFAFALYDCRREQLVLARDGFGIKPCYYAQVGGGLVCASELKAVLCVPQVERKLSWRALDRYLTFLWVPEPETLLEGVHKLPAGHFAVFREGELTLTQYWDPEFPEAGDLPKTRWEDALAGTRERLAASVTQQLVSDVPLGAFLSAGLDSTSIVACMAGAGHRPIHTYTITFPKSSRLGENTLDDPRVPRDVASHFGCHHDEIVLEADVASLLPTAVWSMDDPVADPAILCTHVLCAEAGRTSTVLLSGVGGDELFAGYRKYVAHYWAEAYCHLPGPLRRRLIEPLIGRLPALRGSRWKGQIRLLQKMARSASLPPRERFVMNCTYQDRQHRDRLYSPDLRERCRDFNPADIHEQHFARIAHADFLHQMLYLDLKVFQPSLNLNYADKMAMASSVEVRVPFLSRPLFEYVAREIPPQWKLRGTSRPTTKYILREAMRGAVPDAVLHQKKAGFFAPIDGWLAGPLRPMVDDLLAEDRLRQRGIFDVRRVHTLIEEHRTGRVNWSMQLWQLLTLELWMQTFMDSPSQIPVDPSAAGLRVTGPSSSGTHPEYARHVP
jgi:asparagine synthase (glutamine-hydrolysing)